MTIQNPPVLEHGFVVGRYVTAIADTLGDEDRYPDLRPITGRIKFTPLQSVHLKGGEYPATVVKQPITVDLNEQGYVEDVESRNDPNRNPGVYLAVGNYRVEPIFEQATRVDRFTIQVTADHTKENPLDLTLAAPIETPPGFTEVVRIVDRVRAEDAADAAESHAATALVYRDEAAQSAATAQTHSADAGESAEAAEGHADRAEAARDDTLAQAIEVDATAGTKVTIGGHVVHYDSGWRDMSDYLVDGLAISSNAGRARMRRVNSTVEFDVKVDISSSGVTTIFTGIPAPFRAMPMYPMSNQIFIADGRGAGASALEGNQRVGVFYPTAQPLQTGGSTPWPNPGTVAWTDSYSTHQPFPTSLPGTPA